MEQLFSFEIKEILWNFDKIKIIDLALLYSCEIENFLRENKFPGNLIWSSYINVILTGIFKKLHTFGKSIWSSYNMSKLCLLADFSRKVANFAKTL